jgi:DNA-binding response OmpR family regulator
MAATRILCLEDDEDTCELSTAMLEPEGYQVITASNIEEALRLIEADGFSLYIVDETLPDGHGFDFIRQVRQSGSGIPILVHSAAAFKQDIDDAIEAGADGYLVKPNGWPKLVETVERLLHRSLSAK